MKAVQYVTVVNALNTYNWPDNGDLQTSAFSVCGAGEGVGDDASALRSNEDETDIAHQFTDKESLQADRY